MTKTDYLIVGSGLTGAVIARQLQEAGKKVLVLERRSHVGGNVHDHVHETGIRVHTYGPHYFRTSDERIWTFVNRFAEFYKYVASLKSWVDGEFENWPIAASYIRNHIGEKWEPSFKGKASNFEEAALSLMPVQVYEKFIKGYNIKQWGVDPKELSPQLVKRFDVREDDDPRLMPHHKYQGIPRGGYAKFMERMLEGIPVRLNIDYLNNKDAFGFNRMLIYTGPIDEFFNYEYGKLKYRGQQRVHEWIDNKEWYQPCGQVNNPDLNNGPHIRTLEWKHMMEQSELNGINGTLITKEVTCTPDNPEAYEYPFPDQVNEELFKRYKEKAAGIPGLLICGRLGEYKYYDMDQAIARAFMLVEKKILMPSAP
ncbi:MAG TPA: FAD-dependent oxidoreductase [Chitinophagaceae bacterium]|nr:FAD-dependent oxidoreductase [Chitinophagaceae bacterium]